jgi:hypothetical protein
VVLLALAARQAGHAVIVQGGRLHDRNSVRLSTLLLWQWTQAEKCFITDTGLEVHADLMKYLVRKEGEKLFGKDAAQRDLGKTAVEQLTAAILSPTLPERLPQL